MAMKVDKNMEDPVYRKRLRRKFLERWENEGGRIGMDHKMPPQPRDPGERGRHDPSQSKDSTPKGDGYADPPKKPS
jgi:hypothetical protein